MEEDLDLEWDESNVEHIRRHGIAPQEVLEVFRNEAMDLKYETVNGRSGGPRSGTAMRCEF